MRAGIDLWIPAGRVAVWCGGTGVVGDCDQPLAQGATVGLDTGNCTRPAPRGGVYFPLVAFPSITVVHLVPSCDISNVKLYDVDEVIFMVKRPFMTMPP